LDVSLGANDKIIRDGLGFYVDAADEESYSGGDVWHDLSGGGHDATKWGTLNSSNDAGGSISFDGGGFTIPSWDGFLNAEEFTIEVWAKLRSHRSYNTGIVTNYLSGNGKFNWMWTNHTAFHNNGKKSHTYSAESKYDHNVWYRFALRYKADTGYQFFVNEQIVHTHSTSGSLAGGASGNIGIGSREDGVEACDALFSIVRIYERALSDTEMSDNFNSDKARFGY